MTHKNVFLIIHPISLHFILLSAGNILLTSSDSCSASDRFSAHKCNLNIRTAVQEASAFTNPLIEAADKSLAEYAPCISKNCSCYFNVLRKDLEFFASGITKKMVNDVRGRGSTYVVLKNRLFRSKECVFPARCSGVEHFLRELLPKLPDMEFVLNTRDWPQISRHFGVQGPVFSFSKTPEYLDIQFPAWSFWEGGPAISTYPTGIGRWDIMRNSLLGESTKWPWEGKIDKGFFRGSRTSSERDNLVLLSRQHPDLLDAQYTKNQAWKSPADTLNADPAAVVTFEHHCRYRYLFNMRGVAASFRYKHLFLCGSLVIHFGDDWSEFFYEPLKPWVHYVPLAASATQHDIAALLDFLRQHDELAAKIAHRGQLFIKEHLRLKDVRCYWRNLLRRYSKLLQYDVTLDRDLIEIV